VLPQRGVITIFVRWCRANRLQFAMSVEPPFNRSETHGEGIAKMLCSMYSVFLCFWYLVLPVCGRSMYLFPNKGRRSQAGFGCVLVVGSSDQAHFSGMALGDTVRSTLHPLLPAPLPAGRGAGRRGSDVCRCPWQTVMVMVCGGREEGKQYVQVTMADGGGDGGWWGQGGGEAMGAGTHIRRRW
jgi:hypothetical protein